MPEHNHGGSTGGRTIYQQGGNKTIQDLGNNTSVGGTRYSSSHTHAIYNDGGGQPHENRPPYFALAYIMRIN